MKNISSYVCQTLYLRPPLLNPRLQVVAKENGRAKYWGLGDFLSSFTFLIFSSQRVKASYECDLVTDLRTFLRDFDRTCHHTSTERRGKIQTRE